MAEWRFLTNHARALLHIAHEPESRLVDIAAAIGVTERTTYTIVEDLTKAGYLVKERDGRRNRYHIKANLPLRDSEFRERTTGEFVDLFIDDPRRGAHRRRRSDPEPERGDR
jgi:DNA-binding IclR family transcriptional regulator